MKNLDKLNKKVLRKLMVTYRNTCLGLFLNEKITVEDLNEINRLLIPSFVSTLLTGMKKYTPTFDVQDYLDTLVFLLDDNDKTSKKRYDMLKNQDKLK